nr:immunoglobulin light chain junction region [Macaca mulatta]
DYYCSSYASSYTVF